MRNVELLLRRGDLRFSVECHFAKESYGSINATLAAIAKIKKKMGAITFLSSCNHCIVSGVKAVL